MKWGIIGALDEEIKLIKESLLNTKEHRFHFLTVYEGQLGNDTLYCAVCSVATVNAAICTQLIIDKFEVDYIINTGIAGAIASGITPLSVVISRSVVYHDRDPVINKFSPYTTEFQSDDGLIDRAFNAVSSLGIKCNIGKIATGDIFVSSAVVKESIASLCNPLCVEMEGAAIAQTAFMNKVPFVIIRTMSDNADNDADETYHNLFEIAAQNSAKTVIKMITEE